MEPIPLQGLPKKWDELMAGRDLGKGPFSRVRRVIFWQGGWLAALEHVISSVKTIKIRKNPKSNISVAARKSSSISRHEYVPHVIHAMGCVY
ncbi:hypothetical protein [Paraburkholderia youngii]|uniref:Uncharacterized protein n=1 Tax=Paraburkholderia youngii TaxID=2782701 RepID=A0A7W8L3R1_9BURK|nr:hypothetical protein [Paraburkholderia youngii]MBB5399922.1 hypothetical protein [Paraburkholderia youngii]